jgi:hypothetical protein
VALMNEGISKASHQVQNDRLFKATGSEPVPVPFWGHSNVRDQIRSLKRFPPITIVLGRSK